MLKSKEEKPPMAVVDEGWNDQQGAAVGSEGILCAFVKNTIYVMSE